MKKIFIILIPIMLIAGFLAYKEYNRTAPSTANMEAAYTLDANTLFDAFEYNEEEANAKYLDKVIVVSGNVESINKQDASVQVILYAENAMIGGVNCELQDGNAISNLPQEGDEIQIKGICQGYLMNVILNQCIILEK